MIICSNVKKGLGYNHKWWLSHIHWKRVQGPLLGSLKFFGITVAMDQSGGNPLGESPATVPVSVYVNKP